MTRGRSKHKPLIVGGEAAKRRGDTREYNTAFHMLLDDNMHRLWTKLKEKGVGGATDDETSGGGGQGFRGNADFYDKLFGVFRTATGARRRIDVVLVPRDQLPFALVGWTGSKMYNRFLRMRAKERGMLLCSHCLVRVRDRRVVGQAADDAALDGLALAPYPPAAPLDAEGREWWPPGWADEREGTWNGRTVSREEDVFQLLGLPFRVPADRDCPS